MTAKRRQAACTWSNCLACDHRLSEICSSAEAAPFVPLQGVLKVALARVYAGSRKPSTLFDTDRKWQCVHHTRKKQQRVYPQYCQLLQIKFYRVRVIALKSLTSSAQRLRCCLAVKTYTEVCIEVCLPLPFVTAIICSCS